MAGKKGDLFITNMVHHKPYSPHIISCKSSLLGEKMSQTAALEDQNYSSITSRPGLPTALRDHDYATYNDSGVLIDLQYADYICWVGGNCSHAMEIIKANIPSVLSQRDLHINLTKSEEYIIQRRKSVREM